MSNVGEEDRVMPTQIYICSKCATECEYDVDDPAPDPLPDVVDKCPDDGNACNLELQ